MVGDGEEVAIQGVRGGKLGGGEGEGVFSQAWRGGDLVVPVPEAALTISLGLGDVEYLILRGCQ